MGELRIRNLPEDLRVVLQAIAKRDRISIRVAAIMLMRVGQTVRTIKGQGTDTGQSVEPVRTVNPPPVPAPEPASVRIRRELERERVEREESERVRKVLEEGS